MAAILKTWPAFMTPAKVRVIFAAFPTYYFTIGRGKPQREVEQLWFTHRGRLVGHFDVSEIKINIGDFPRLSRIDGEPSEWQIKPDRWVAICLPPFHKLTERVYHEAFRGWRYFDYEAYVQTIDSKIRV